MDVRVAFCTFPDAETALRIVREIVDLRLAACGNVLPQVHSVYRWQGKVEEGTETMVFFKTTRFEELQAKLRSLHPYDVPEIIALSVADGLPAYLQWVEECCS